MSVTTNAQTYDSSAYSAGVIQRKSQIFVDGYISESMTEDAIVARLSRPMSICEVSLVVSIVEEEKLTGSAKNQTKGASDLSSPRML